MAVLTPKQQAFVAEYLVDLCSAKAAIRAGYSERTARVIGVQLLNKPLVAEAIQKAQEQRSKRTEITADRVLEEYAKLAFLDPRKFFDDSGNLIDVHKLPADVAAALSAMDVIAERVGEDEKGKPLYAMVRKIKFADKKGALDSVARHLGMFVDKTEHTGPGGVPLMLPKLVVEYVSPKGGGDE